MEKKDNSTLDNVMRRLRKLQKLYEGAKSINSEGEANAAAAKIQEILTEYNLTMEEVGEEKEETPVGHEYASGFSYPSISGPWEYLLTDVICKYNYCKCYMVGGTYKKILIVGEKHNIEIVKWLKEVLTRVFVNLSKVRWNEFKDSPEHSLNPIYRDTFQRAYLKGCAAGLEAKLHIEREAEKANQQTGGAVTALVLKKDVAIQKYVSENFKEGKGKNLNYCKGSGFAINMGYKDGKATDINKAVESTKKQTMKALS